MRRAAVIVVLVLAAVGGAAGPATARPAGTGTAASVDRPAVPADFDGDGVGDLAVGAPGEAVGAVPGAGSVTVLYGDPGGLPGPSNQLFTQDTPGVGSTVEPFDAFGSALAWGDLDGDGFDDLAVGAVGESVGDVLGAGTVTVLFGSDLGLTGEGSRLFTFENSGIPSSAQVGDSYGAALAIGDLDGDGIDDLVAGAPNKEIDGAFGAGTLLILYGSPTGPNGTGLPTTQLTQNTAGVPSSAEDLDAFGAALAVGDVNGSGVADLVVGVPGETVGTVPGAGGVHVFFGRTTGVNGTSAQLITQATEGVAGDPEPFDFMGAALAAADFDGEGFADVAAGVPEESVGSVALAGAVYLFQGGTGGLTVSGQRVLHQDVAGIGSTAEVGDQFGSALAAGDLNGDPDDLPELVVGVPFESVGTVPDAGAAHVLPGSVGDGPLAAGSLLLHQDVGSIGSTAEAFDQFGAAFAIADLDGDGLAELTVGVPGESVGDVQQAGAVNVISGTTGPVIHQDVSGVPSTAEDGDVFGAALAAAP